MIDVALQVSEQTQERAIIRAWKILQFITDNAIHPHLLTTLCSFIIDWHLAFVTSKNCRQQETLPEVTKTTDSDYPINRADNRKGRWGNLDPSVRLNDFSRVMSWLIICLGWSSFNNRSYLSYLLNLQSAQFLIHPCLNYDAREPVIFEKHLRLS